MSDNFFYILLLVITCLVSAISQALLKKAALKDYPSFIRQYLNAKVVLAYSLFFAVVVANIYILRFVPMIVVSPIAETLPYALSIAFGCVFFGEKITKAKIIGALFIIAGICVIVI